MKLRYIIFPLICLTVINHVLAAAISVSPTKLEVQTEVKKEVKRTLTIKNISSTPQVYNLYSDELEEIISITPIIFRLDPEEQTTVTLTIKPLYSGILATNISVIAEDIDRRRFNAAAGVKVPLQIIALPGPKINYTKWFIRGIISLLIVLALILIIISLSKRRKRSFWQKITRPINLLHHKKKWWQKLLK